MSYPQIEDQRDNPINRAPRPQSMDDERREERFALLTRTPVVFHSPAVIAARARLQAYIAERKVHAAADSMWSAL